MEGTPLGRGTGLKVEREFECSRIEGQLLAAAYEEVVPVIRRQPAVASQSYDQKAREGHGRATVGA